MAADESKRALGARSMEWIGVIAAIVTGLLGILFWPLWILTAISLVYVVLGFFAKKKG